MGSAGPGELVAMAAATGEVGRRRSVVGKVLRRRGLWARRLQRGQPEGVGGWAPEEGEAKAAMINAQPSYILLTAGNPGGDEFLVVMDRVTEKLVAYRQNGDKLDLIAGRNFGKLFK